MNHHTAHFHRLHHRACRGNERDFARTRYAIYFAFFFRRHTIVSGSSTFAGADESALFHRLDGIAIGRQRAYFFIIFQAPQNWVAAERISFKLVSVLHVRQQVLFSLCEFRQDDWQLSSSPFLTSIRRRVSSPFRLVEVLATQFGSRRHTAATAGTTGYAPTFRRASDWQPRCRLR